VCVSAPYPEAGARPRGFAIYPSPLRRPPNARRACDRYARFPPRRLQPGPSASPVRHRLHSSAKGKRGEPSKAGPSNAPACSNTDACLCGVSASRWAPTPHHPPRRGRAVRVPKGAACRGRPWAQGVKRAGVPSSAASRTSPLKRPSAPTARPPRVGQQRHRTSASTPNSATPPGVRAQRLLWRPRCRGQLMGRDGAYALEAWSSRRDPRRPRRGLLPQDLQIDHVVHGAIASAATFGAMMGSTARADARVPSGWWCPLHSLPRHPRRQAAQRSKGASAAISTEAAILSVKRSMPAS